MKKKEAIVHIKMAHRILWTWITTYILATMDSYTGKQTIRIKQSGSSHRGRASDLIYLTVFVIFCCWKFTFCQLRNINVMSHTIYIMLFYKKKTVQSVSVSHNSRRRLKYGGDSAERLCNHLQLLTTWSWKDNEKKSYDT